LYLVGATVTCNARDIGMVRLRRFLKNRSVAKAIEYSLIAVAIGVAVAAAILNFGDQLNALPGHL
jgi:Flp pilus assembly pilin Flp